MNSMLRSLSIVKKPTQARIRLALRPRVIGFVKNRFDRIRVNVNHPQSIERLLDQYKLGNHADMLTHQVVYTSDDIIIHVIDSLLLTLSQKTCHTLEEHRLATHRAGGCLGVPFFHTRLTERVTTRQLHERFLREAHRALHSYVPYASQPKDQ